MGGDNTAKLKIVIDAQNNADSVFKSIGSSLKNLEPAFKTAAVAGGALFAAVSGEGVLALNAFSDAQSKMTVANQALSNSLKSMSKSDLAALKKSVGDTGSAMDGIQKMMADTSKAAIQLGFDDEDTSQAFARLFQSTKSVTETQRELKLAMDLSAYSGRTLEDSVLALQQVHAGGARVLREFGLQVDDTKDSMSVLAAVEDTVGGSAAKMQDTIATKTKALNVELQNLQENIGQALAPALVGLLTAVTPIVEKVSEWIAQHPQLTAAIAALVAAVFGLIAVVGTLGVALFGLMGTAAALGIGLGTLLGLILLIPIAIAAVIAAAYELITNWTMVKEFFVSMWATVEAVTVKVWDEIKAYLTGLWEDLKADFQAVYDWFVSKINSIKSLYDGIKSKLSSVGGAVSNAVKSVVHVNDAIIRPDGQIITTHPDDYLIATKDPAGLGGGVTVNINGGMFLSEDAAEQFGDLLMRRLKLSNAI